MEKNEEIRGILEIWRCRRKRPELKASAESPDLPGSPLSPFVLKRNPVTSASLR